jgi:DNA-binding MarR family transcriptional regulator
MSEENEQLQEILDIIFKWDKAIRILERTFNKEFDLTLNQCRVIIHILDKNFVELSQINEWLNIDKSTTTRMIRPLLVHGYIDKFYQFGDKRKIYLRISEKGEANVLKVKAAIDKMAKKSLIKIPSGKRDFMFQTVNDFLKTVE